MNAKKIIKAILFPPVFIMIILLPTAAVLTSYSMVFLGTHSPVSVISYVLSAYTVTVYSLRIPSIIRCTRDFKRNNKRLDLYFSSPEMRVKVSLYFSFIFNTAYALFNLGLGFYHSSFWFFSMAIYYILLSHIRFSLLRYTKKNEPGDSVRKELIKYRAVGIILLIMNLAVSFMMFFMVYFERSFRHHEITTITLAAYTFTTFTLSIINIVKHRKNESPVYSAARAVRLISASVSLLTLESTMLTTFGGETSSPEFRKIMLTLSGAMVSCFIILTSLYMIIKSTRKLKEDKYGKRKTQ